MRTAVMRVVIDTTGQLSSGAYERGLAQLRDEGFEVVASPADKLPDTGREVELIVDGFDPGDRANYVEACSRAFGTAAAAGVVTYISRGTDADAQGVLDGFDVTGKVERSYEGDDEVVTVTLDPFAMRRVPESRLHTALEAALNCEVRIQKGA